MVTPGDAIIGMRKAGHTMSVEDGELKVVWARPPRDPDTVKNLLKKHHFEIIRLLEAEQTEPVRSVLEVFSGAILKELNEAD